MRITLRSDRHRRRSGFTLTELLVVVGLIGLLVSLLLPVLGKMRAAANAAVCMSNLRQMGTAWMMYTTENRGRFIEYVWQTPQSPEAAWTRYWPGLLDDRAVRGEMLLCPTAQEPTLVAANRGYGNATAAWTGRYSPTGSAIRFNGARYRDGSFGFNRYLTAGGGFDESDRITAVRGGSDVPVLMDAAFIDFRPVNGSEAAPVQVPPNLRGSAITPASPDHWLFLIARHGRGINSFMADGSVQWVPLDDAYMLTWKANWVKYRLDLPKS